MFSVADVMINQVPATLKDELRGLIEWLANFGKTENGGVTRLLYDANWRRAQQAIKEKMTAGGLTAYFDDVGNLFGRIDGRSGDRQVILTGSHVDTVAGGGKYDGAYGILAALIAAGHLLRRFGAPQRTIEVVSLCEEEGSRFPLSFWGSGNITGKYRIKEAERLIDTAGVSMKQAMNEAGFGRGHYPQPFRTDIACFLETHIEQGRTLELEQKTWAPVSHIVGQRRYTISLIGESNHAGTTPMAGRKDAIYTAALMINDAVGAAAQAQNGLVATVGRIIAAPNMPNVISGNCRFTLDIRHHEQAVLNRFSAKIKNDFTRIARSKGVRLQIEKWMDVPPVKLDEKLTAMNLKQAKQAGIAYRRMISGAGHDAQIFAPFCPTALMFVPSHLGVSHAPDEFTSPDDLAVGVRMLMKVLYRLAYVPEEKVEEKAIH
jgi:allantoate deiminase